MSPAGHDDIGETVRGVRCTGTGHRRHLRQMSGRVAGLVGPAGVSERQGGPESGEEDATAPGAKGHGVGHRMCALCCSRSGGTSEN